MPTHVKNAGSYAVFVLEKYIPQAAIATAKTADENKELMRGDEMKEF
jgi:hypothetical protein